MKRRAIAILAAAAVALAVALALILRPGAKDPVEPAASRPEPALATVVAQTKEVDETWVAEGAVEAVRQANVAAQIAGRIVELKVEAGETVRRGQLIARIDEREAAQVVASNEAQIARAEADLGNARANLDRTRRLVEQKFMSPAALDRAQAEFDAARAQLGVARAGSGAAQTTRSYATITAPFDGVVAERLVAAGDMAQPGRPLLTLYDPREVRVVANVPQAKIPLIRAAGGAVAEFPSLGQTVAARALTVLPAADARTHTQPVRLDLASAPAGVVPGMFARAQFPIGRSTKLVIPASAVVRRSEVTGAYVVAADGRIELRQIRLGAAAGADGVEVLAGIQPGERVATEPPQAIAALRTRGK